MRQFFHKHIFWWMKMSLSCAIIVLFKRRNERKDRMEVEIDALDVSLCALLSVTCPTPGGSGGARHIGGNKDTRVTEKQEVTRRVRDVSLPVVTCTSCVRETSV